MNEYTTHQATSIAMNCDVQAEHESSESGPFITIVDNDADMELIDLYEDEPEKCAVKGTMDEISVLDSSQVHANRGGGWADFVDDGDLDVRYNKLSRLQIVLSRSLKYRDLAKYYQERTVAVSPITYGDLTSGVLSEFFQKSLGFCSSFNIDNSREGISEYDGTLFLHFKKKDIVEKEIELLRNIRQGLKVCLVNDGESAEGSKGAQRMLEKTLWCIKPGESSMATNAIGYNALPTFNDDSSLFTTTISESVTEDQLWELFPSARFIVFCTEPVGQSVAGAEPMSQSVAGAEPISQTVTGAAPISQSVTGAEPMSQSVIGAEPMSQSVTGAEPMSQSVAGAEPMSQSVAGAQPISQTVIGAEPMSQSVTGAEPMSQSVAGAEPRRTRLYVMFNSEKALQDSVEALKTMSPSLPPFQFTRLSSANRAFQKCLPPGAKKIQKKCKGVDTAVEVGKQGTKQRPNTVTIRASPAQQVDRPPTARSGKKRKKAGSKAATQDEDRTFYIDQGSNENPDPDAYNGSGSSPNADQHEMKLSKGQRQRLNRRRRAQEEERTEPVAVQQLHQPQQPHQPQQIVAKKQKKQSPKQEQTPPQPDYSAGLALLQTLTNLAHNMFSAQVNPFQMPAQPQPQRKRENRDQHRDQGHRQGQQEQYCTQADNSVGHSTTFSTVNQRFYDSLWKLPQDGPLGDASTCKNNSCDLSTQDYVSFEDSSLNN